MNDPIITLTTAFIIGLLGGAHCIGMCGGIMNALSFALPEQQRKPRSALPTLLLYNTGRIFSYAVAGALVGGLGMLLQGSGGILGPGLRIFAGLMLIAMGLYLAGWWRGLVHLEKLGAHVWKYLQPLGKRLMPVTRPSQALLLGTLWGWLPCGLTYSTLSLAASTGSWHQAALVMASFGLGTLPVMLASGVFAHRLKGWIQNKRVRNTAGMLVIGFGVWTIASPLSHMTAGHAAHTPAMQHGTEPEQEHAHH
ncbi:MAG: sulfite exporter TauE/SafE family protein [Gammaproteobacteria bacterium]|nr:sulfite exporter TauE/SafE family protein [Gammaproteobacteria bacterium]MCF6363118.1 sulfite exporter TauE/SafE family protein [Gammaproteobacteria bacterium]